MKTLKALLFAVITTACLAVGYLQIKSTNQSIQTTKLVREPDIAGVANISIAQQQPASSYRIGLPTVNRNIFSDPPNYYMYTDREFEGVKSKPWQGGQYGFTRNQKRTKIGIVYTRLHEGIDVRPVKRNSAGEPLDDVYSISDGKVVYVNTSATASSYGKYVVVRHDFPEGPFYTLYAHLAWPTVSVGKSIRAGEAVGRLGYTGRGINKERAHLHMEMNFMLSERFTAWYGKHFSSKNNHYIYNGFNLTGIDIARFYRERSANPAITIPDFLSREEPYFKVVCPTPKGLPDILKRHPFLIKNANGGNVAKSPAWEFTFARSGVPISASPKNQSLKYPFVSWVKTVYTDHSYMTMGRLTGVGAKATLTNSGSRYIQLITGNF